MTAIRLFITIRNRFKLLKNRNERLVRRLEIGPGAEYLEGFESLNISYRSGIDYISQANSMNFFNDKEFDLVYASHVLEHIAWFQVEQTLEEWYRIIKIGGCLEVWVPDVLKITQALIDYENDKLETYCLDGWFRLNQEKDPYKWFNGRIFSYGDETSNFYNPNWHHSSFTPNYLSTLLLKVGFDEVVRMDNTDVRGHDHGWINLGFRAIKSR